jgi:hypothetical protein
MSYQTPLVSYLPTNLQVGRNHRLALTAAVTADANDKAEVLMVYILKHPDRNYVALIYDSVELSFIGNVFSITVAKINRENPGPEFELSTFPVEGGSPNSCERALREIKEWGWKTVAVALGHLNQWEQMYNQVEKQGMALGEHGYVWYSFDTIDLDTLAVYAADWIPTPPGKGPWDACRQGAAAARLWPIPGAQWL